MKPLSVAEISNYITQIFNSEEMLHNVKVYGEISGLNVVRGNAYFNIKDENSLLSCIMFNYSQGLTVKEGDQVLIEGSVGYYGKGGKINFYTQSIMPYGLGILYQKFIELKEKLQLEGLFDPKFKKSLPDSIKNIGIVTSATGAVLQDIKNVTSRRNPFLNLFLYPAKVQGEGADVTIIEGINYFQDKNIDVIIVARGGGSFEDLQPFNSESLARVAFLSKIPIISAVGHETDFTILDFVASLRAPTPSAAAEIVSKDIMSEFYKTVMLSDRLLKSNQSFFSLKLKNVISHAESIKNKLRVFYEDFKNKTVFNAEKTKNLAEIFIINAKHSLESKTLLLENLNPAAMLLRGYAQAYKNNKVINDISLVNVNDEIDIVLNNGKMLTKVLSKKENK